MSTNVADIPAQPKGKAQQEVVVTDKICYVSKAGRDAWLEVKMDGMENISLPQYLKLRVIKTEKGRDFFKILEGHYQGKKGNVKTGYLISKRETRPAAKVKFKLKEQALWYGEKYAKGPFSAFSGSGDRFTPVSPGKYLLPIPAYPSAMTRKEYYQYTPFHRTWFNVEGVRFLHVGVISEGCVTVRAFLYDGKKSPPAGFQDLPSITPGLVGLPWPKKMNPIANWDDLYNYLIIARADDKNVGTLVVE